MVVNGMYQPQLPPLIFFVLFFYPPIPIYFTAWINASHSIRVMFAFGPFRTPLQPMWKLGARAFKLARAGAQLRLGLCVLKGPIGFLGFDRCSCSPYLYSMIVGWTPH